MLCFVSICDTALMYNRLTLKFESAISESLLLAWFSYVNH
jgi:hypothetical protein